MASSPAWPTTWATAVVALNVPTLFLEMGPSVDAADTQKSKSVLARFIEESAQTGPDFKVVSVDTEKIWPRTARFGNYSGILECEISARITVTKISTGKRLVMGLDNLVLYYAYDQKEELVVETP